MARLGMKAAGRTAGSKTLAAADRARCRRRGGSDRPSRVPGSRLGPGRHGEIRPAVGHAEVVTHLTDGEEDVGYAVVAVLDNPVFHCRRQILVSTLNSRAPTRSLLPPQKPIGVGRICEGRVRTPESRVNRRPR